MKTTRKIFSLFNLLLFVGSFCFTSLSGMASTANPQSVNPVQKQFCAKQDVDDGNASAFFLEKNENETENDLQLQAILLPFFASYFQFEITEISYTTTTPVEVTCTNPIYLSVCNFRV